MEFSLEDLQKMLMDVQETKPIKKLSERNTINILQYVKTQSDLVIITDKEGKTFYTPEALDKEIYQHINSAKKIRMNELER